MAVSRERFEQGLSYADYKDQMTRNRDRLEENESAVALDPEVVQFFKDLPKSLNVLVITEDWCGDAVANVPVLARLAAESKTLNLRFFLRDQNKDLIQPYLKEGRFESIPVFVFFDQDFNELGFWIERPAKMSEIQGAKLGLLFASDPAFQGVEPGTSPAMLPEGARNRMFQFFGEFREETRAISDREVQTELQALVAGNVG